MKHKNGKKIKRKRFHLHPGMVVSLVAVAVVCSLFLIRYITPESVETNVTLLEREKVNREESGPTMPNLFSEQLGTGASFIAANRVGELTNLVLSVGIYRFKTEAEKRVPYTSEALIAGLRNENYLPPGMEVASQQGKLNTPYSTFYVRYRAVPFAVEVVSVPRSENKGNAMLLRLPADPNEPMPVDASAQMELRRIIEGVTVDPQTYYAFYTSLYTMSANVPTVAFMPPADMLNFGWNKQNLPRSSPLSVEQIAELKNWLNKVQ